MKPAAAIVAILLAGMVGDASSHSGSTAYLQAVAEGDSVQLRADYALRDLDDALGIDADDDGRLTWGELQSASPKLVGYLLQRISLWGDDQSCSLVSSGPVQLADRADGPYAVFRFVGSCSHAPARWRLDDDALFDLDASHRALLRWQLGDEISSATLAPGRSSFVSQGVRGTFETLREYFGEGLRHVWSGWDHMLFIAGLFLPAALRRRNGKWQPVERLAPALIDAVKLVTAFTIAHAVTLCLTALGVVALPTHLVESLVALSVLFAGFNNLVPVAGRRALFALAWLFGLIHGSAIAGALLELGLPATGRVMALLGFNLGVEAAQLLIVGTLVPIAFALRRWRGYVPALMWPGSALVAAAGLIWLINRAFAMEWTLPI